MYANSPLAFFVFFCAHAAPVCIVDTEFETYNILPSPMLYTNKSAEFYAKMFRRNKFARRNESALTAITRHEAN